MESSRPTVVSGCEAVNPGVPIQENISTIARLTRSMTSTLVRDNAPLINGHDNAGLGDHNLVGSRGLIELM